LSALCVGTQGRGCVTVRVSVRVSVGVGAGVGVGVGVGGCAGQGE
jgi:hypothetical protein